MWVPLVNPTQPPVSNKVKVPFLFAFAVVVKFLNALQSVAVTESIWMAIYEILLLSVKFQTNVGAEEDMFVKFAGLP